MSVFRGIVQFSAGLFLFALFLLFVIEVDNAFLFFLHISKIDMLRPIRF